MTFRCNRNGKNQSSYTKKATSVILIIGIVFIAANLRASLTSVGPLTSMIRDGLDISGTLTGMITTLPLLAFALVSPLVPSVSRKFGAELVLFWSVVTLTIGILLRSWSGSFGLFLGTAILGISISAGNVLMPSLIKKNFHSRKQVGIMSGAYSVSMNIFAALASGVSIPVAVGLGLGWEGSLRIWAILSLVAVIFWIPQVAKSARGRMSINGETADRKVSSVELSADMDETAAQKPSIKKNNVWKSSLAWQVTIYMGLQSMVFYCMVAWLPNILIQQGMGSGAAGWMLSLMQMALVPMTFVGSVLAGRKTNQRSLVVVGSACTIIGLWGLLFFGQPGLVFIWIIILGIGGGFTFSLSMMFFSLRTENVDEAARLSGMAQSIGYLLAAIGPMLFGYLHDATNSWAMPLIVLLGAAGLCLFFGLGASRDLYVGATLAVEGISDKDVETFVSGS